MGLGSYTLKVAPENDGVEIYRAQTSINVTTEIAGTWESSCYEIGSYYAKDTVEFEANGGHGNYFRSNRVRYTASDCDESTKYSRMYIDGLFSLDGLLDGSGDAKVNITFGSSSIAALSDQAATDYSNSAKCGRNWSKRTDGSTYTTTGDQSCGDGFFVTKDSVNYEIFQVKDGTLTFGNPTTFHDSSAIDDESQRPSSLSSLQYSPK